MDLLKELYLAVRPWSFTAAVIPILITTAVTQSSFLSVEFFRALIMGVFIQGGANLTNTYFDYFNGVDTKEHSSDLTLVEKKLHPVTLLSTSFACYFIGTAAVMPLVTVHHRFDIAVIFVIGILLAFFYTASPVGLKYIALGDVTIFVCFGPLLMQCTSLILTGSFNHDINYYTIPIGLLTEGILHANNARDIKADTQVGAVTLASLIGFDNSYIFYAFLVYGAYLAVVVIALVFHAGCLLTLLTLPLGIGLLKKFQNKEMANLTEETAKVHLPFGILLLAGVLTRTPSLLSVLGF